ncbi:MAG: dTDP-4-dehydrorhamnose reductase [Chlorobium sp.]|uniref:dTDP-4-dehydrorhamnose reductase n=1 Tax=Chlorobium sp. TaxID=1095 RepID=UPI0025BF66B7|nr:dTDP-4-dehydrorhamnose reductase [Chlorobium sp.]MCF8383856.1 dTDP-4-dehydrorhamnose reductase [Chlorobium sp.]
MNILVTGSNGQLGTEIKALAAGAHGSDFFFFDLPELDITSPAQVAGAMQRCGCNVVINCAAYTAVDRAESEPELASRVNCDGAGVLARCAREQGALLLHVSTDYVFDGHSCRPYRESDHPAPLGVYGQSKLAGEKLIQEIAPSYLIIRTSWLYSLHGQNFLKTMLRLGRERDRIDVVFDQIGTPTCAADLAGAILDLLGRVRPEKRYAGLYHYSNEGVCSWYDFALAIMRMKHLPCRVFPIESSGYPTPAPRPFYSVLNKGAIKKEWGLDIPHWHDSLEVLLARSDNP